MLEFKVTPDASGQRLDKFLRRRLATVPLSHLYKMVRTKKVRVNGARAEIGQQLAEGDVVTVRGSEENLVAPRPAQPAAPRPVGKDFEVLHEDEHILVANKPAGLAIHTGTGITGDTLVDQVRHYFEQRGFVVPEGEFKPSPAHRLDRETSGVVVIAKTRQAMVRLTEIFTDGQAHKRYLALAKGRFQRDRGTIDVRLPEHQQTAASRQQRGVNMQEAVTHWKLLRGGPEASLLDLEIETGRTHQIRRHLAAIGHPVVGDAKYGDFPFNRRAKSAFGLKRMFLHSAQLTLLHPVTNKRLSLHASLPADLAEVLPRAGIEWTG
jgi:23S rRNA pseudouridine955/2504/2580 synthase